MLTRRPDGDPRRGARGRGTKRGAHLMLSVERLDRLAASPVQRVGALGDAAAARGDRALRLRRPADRARRRGHREAARPEGRRAGRGHARARRGRPSSRGCRRRAARAAGTSIWPSIYPEILRLVEEHRSTIVFVNNRRLAERLALRLNELAEEEIAARAPRLARPRAARARRGGAEGRPDPLPRRHLVARARDRHGRGRPRDPGRVAEVGRARPAADRPRGPRARRGLEGPHLPEVPRRPARGRGRRAARCARARSRRP